MKRKTFFITLILAIVLCILAVAGTIVYSALNSKKQKNEVENREAPPVEITLVYAYQNAQWNETILNTVQAFEAANPDVHVNVKTQFQDTVYEDSLKKLIARGELGDIVQLKTPDPYAAEDLLMPVPEEVVSLVDAHYIYDGEVYGVGAVGVTEGIIYNKKIFEKFGMHEPATYEEFISSLNTLGLAGSPLGIAGSELWHLEYWMNHFFRTDCLSVSENWLSECLQGKRKWTDPEAVKMLTHLQEIAAGNRAVYEWENVNDSSLAYLMAEGKISMIYSGASKLKAIAEVDPTMDLGWFYVPDSQGRTFAADTKDVYWALAASCSSDPRKYDAVSRFLKFFFTDQYESIINDVNGLSTLAGLDTEYVLKDKRVLTPFMNATYTTGVYIGNSDTPQGFEEPMLIIVKELMAGRLTPEEAAAQIQEIWENEKV
ncbi:MAG: carbohydrate ABC transporter substrate-binding protein [Parasporobacterium sp.]|nr:carbohydrate ABC transporter substrate-binding protein [Parasporobacterium sp.]